MKKLVMLFLVLSFFLCMKATASAQSMIKVPLSESNANALLNPPKLIADSTRNDINHAIGISFLKDSTWAANINEVWINGREVHFSFYRVFKDSIVLQADVFSNPGANEILVRAVGYKDAKLSQELDEGGVWNNRIISLSPADNSFWVENGTSLVLTFENNVTINEGFIKIFKIEYQVDDGLYELLSSSSDNVTGNGTTQITITSSKGINSGSYYIMIDDNLFGENFKGYNNTYDWTFTTSYMLDELIPGESLGHDVRLTISLPDTYAEDEDKSLVGIFLLDAPWNKAMHTHMHALYDSVLIPVDPVLITIGPPYEKDLWDIRVLDYTRNYDKFYDYLASDLVPFVSENYKLNPYERIMAGGSYAGFMTLYSFFQSCIRQDTTFYSFIPTSPVMAGYYSMMDQLSESADSLGKNLVHFMGELDLDVCLPVYPLLKSWVKDNSFTHFNFYDELFLGRDHSNTGFDAVKIAAEILLNLPKPYFAFKKYSFKDNDTTSYIMIRRWPKNGVLSGNGVSDTCFIPSLAGAGVHTITYTFTDENEQTYSREREVTISAVAGFEEHRTSSFCLYPNPADQIANIHFELEETIAVRLSILNLLGQEERILLNETRQAGEQEMQFDVSGLKAGVYFVRLASDHIETCKLIVW